MHLDSKFWWYGLLCTRDSTGDLDENFTMKDFKPEELGLDAEDLADIKGAGRPQSVST